MITFYLSFVLDESDQNVRSDSEKPASSLPAKSGPTPRRAGGRTKRKGLGIVLDRDSGNAPGSRWRRYLLWHRYWNYPNCIFASAEAGYYCSNCLILIFETLNLAGPGTGLVFYSRFPDFIHAFQTFRLKLNLQGLRKRSPNLVQLFRFTRQWPEMRHVFQCSSLALFLDSASYHTSEKLDGSNLAVTSRGVVASRRTVLLNRNRLHISTRFIREKIVIFTLSCNQGESWGWFMRKHDVGNLLAPLKVLQNCNLDA